VWTRYLKRKARLDPGPGGAPLAVQLQIFGKRNPALRDLKKHAALRVDAHPRQFFGAPREKAARTYLLTLRHLAEFFRTEFEFRRHGSPRCWWVTLPLNHPRCRQ
jgi:hypothetical protein